MFEQFINNPLASECSLRGAQGVTALLAGSSAGIYETEH